MSTSAILPDPTLVTPKFRSAGVWFLCRASKFAQRRSARQHNVDLKRTTNKSEYRNWRATELQNQLTQHFNPREIIGLHVLDFGCGTGELCQLLLEHKPKHLTGVDLSAEAIQRAQSSFLNSSKSDSSKSSPIAWEFVHTQCKQPVPVDDASYDLICCFDVVEHIADVSDTLQEWFRLLKPGGRVWIWWSPWRGPFGHHMDSLIPLPWVHLIFPQRTMFAACAELYDDPDFVPRVWDIDPSTGLKKPNKWRHQQSFYPLLNRLTRREFEREVRQAGLSIDRREVHGFSGSRFSRATRGLLPLPLIGECFVSFFVYELSKPV